MSPWLVKQTVIIKLVKNVRKGNWEIKKKKKKKSCFYQVPQPKTSQESNAQGEVIHHGKGVKELSGAKTYSKQIVNFIFYTE